ncbi:hypothetical protein FOIG_13090 [Fusarium odoratissimum NRRL 54006]|uniref:Uncharacterized protein n=1 Tax=Fusarium odoratissimum (strain NRRL 54006) TaxID=1089451 RepID=X0JCU7_FUSO5|nr:uncharacterized protein FOIG_13090 [Fusarium odoratissimum NRRL 54006]EXL94196.1 hypothetical protein FOIG_13090 [Fusarium odoratissimum NRRL 54006]
MDGLVCLGITWKQLIAHIESQSRLKQLRLDCVGQLHTDCTYNTESSATL